MMKENNLEQLYTCLGKVIRYDHSYVAPNALCILTYI